ncbi:hypothetical protein EVA_00896 [gut metagenome]|uniref:Uncharacterized protein n=1 Tax=gut metagenome TaxID=749906 RepID=J9GQJ8_9ZZZZ
MLLWVPISVQRSLLGLFPSLDLRLIWLLSLFRCWLLLFRLFFRARVTVSQSVNSFSVFRSFLWGFLI